MTYEIGISETQAADGEKLAASHGITLVALCEQVIANEAANWRGIISGREDAELLAQVKAAKPGDTKADIEAKADAAGVAVATAETKEG